MGNEGSTTENSKSNHNGNNTNKNMKFFYD